MSNTNPAPSDPTRSLPERPNLEHLRKEAKQRLKTMRLDDSGATLAAAQLAVAREYGFTSWRRLIAYVKSQADKKSQLLDLLRADSAKSPVRQAILGGLEAIEKGDYQTAAEHFRRAQDANPDFTLFRVQRLVTQEFGDRRWRHLNAYIKSLPDEAQLRRRDSEEVKPDYKTAAAHYRQVITERPTLIPAYYRLGRALVGQRLYSEALDAFEELLKLDPENLLAHYEIGKLSLSFRNHPDEELLYRFRDHKRGFNRENLLAHYEIGKLSLSTQNYAGAIAKYLWLRSQSVSSTTDLSDPSYELLPRKPRTGELTQNPFHRAYASELALYLLDLIPPEVAEQNRLPASQIVYVTPYDTPKDSSQKRQDNLACAKPVGSKTPSLPKILHHEKAKYTEIARINRLEGTISLSVVFNTSGQITDIRVIRGLPDGLTRRAIHAVQQIRFEPTTIDGMPVNVRGKMELNFHLPSDGIAREL
jgi:TonB family protein